MVRFQSRFYVVQRVENSGQRNRNKSTMKQDKERENVNIPRLKCIYWRKSRQHVYKCHVFFIAVTDFKSCRENLRALKSDVKFTGTTAPKKFT